MRFCRTENARLALLDGAAWNREKFGPAAPAVSFTRNSAEVYWGDDFAYKLKPERYHARGVPHVQQSDKLRRISYEFRYPSFYVVDAMAHLEYSTQ
jgi:hypothetical protein